MFSSAIKGRVREEYKFFYKRKDGTSRYAVSNFGLLRNDGKISGMQAINKDITEQKNIE